MAEEREIGYAEDPYAGSYEWGVARVVVNQDERFVIVEEAGCSCNEPGPECSGGVTVGPSATLGGLFDEMYVNMADSDKKPSMKARLAFMDAIERLNADTIKATKAALEL